MCSRAAGDPTLDTPGLARLAGALGKAGAERVEGRLLTYAGALPFVPKVDPDQADHLGYNPAVSGLNLNYNRVHFSWERTGGRYVVELDARAGPYVPAITSARMSIAPRTLPVYTYRQDHGIDEWTVARAALGRGGSRWLPVRNPSRYASDVLGTLARSQGIALPAAAETGAPEGAEIARETSAPLIAIVGDMLLYSTNLTAEALGLASSGAAASLGASARAHGGLGRHQLGHVRGRLRRSLGAQRGDPRQRRGDGRRHAPPDPRPPGPRAASRPSGCATRRGARSRTTPCASRPRPARSTSSRGSRASPRRPSGRALAFAILASDLPRRARTQGDEVPDGARAWNRRAKALQQGLIERWAALYG